MNKERREHNCNLYRLSVGVHVVYPGQVGKEKKLFKTFNSSEKITFILWFSYAFIARHFYSMFKSRKNSQVATEQRCRPWRYDTEISYDTLPNDLLIHGIFLWYLYRAYRAQFLCCPFHAFRCMFLKNYCHILHFSAS